MFGLSCRILFQQMRFVSEELILNLVSSKKIHIVIQINT
jgi:hypothetical protein